LFFHRRLFASYEECTLAAATIALFYHNLLKVKPNIMMRWAEHESRVGEMRTAYKILVEKPGENIPLGNLGISVGVILKWRV
jgi:hypothetical protein